MDMKNDDRLQPKNGQAAGSSTPAPPNASTADNASVYKQPPLEEATNDGTANKMDKNNKEDRKHTP